MSKKIYPKSVLEDAMEAARRRINNEMIDRTGYTGEQIINTLKENNRCFYRFFRHKDIIDELLKNIQIAESVNLPVMLTSGDFGHITVTGRHYFNGRYYLIH